MNRRTRSRVTVGAAAAATFLLATGAQALWSAERAAELPPFRSGAIAFGAEAGGDPGTRQDSLDGSAVTVTLPGSQIIQVLDQTGLDPDPVFWRFRASGAALGITGLTYRVTATSQVDGDGESYDVGSGVARENTVLAGSTIKIYPATTGGDCSAVPAVPEPVAGEPVRNIHVFGDQPTVLQEPGTNLTGREIEQEWCVALRWNHDLDGQYVNDAQVTAIGEDGTDKGAMTQWRAAVAFPPALNPLGTYLNRGSVEATGEDSTISRDHDDWHSVIYPDPSGEPDLVLTLDPVVTNANPAVPDGDTFGFAPVDG